MKKFSLLLGLTLWSLTTPAQSIEINKRNELKIYDAFNSGSFDELDKYITKDAVDHAIPAGMMNGVEGTKAMFKNFKAAFPDGNIKILDIVSEGDYMLVYSEFSGTNKGSFMGMSATNKWVKTKSMDLVRFDRSGKAIEHWGQDDNLTMMQQLGLSPVPQPMPEIPLNIAADSKLINTTPAQNKMTTNKFFEFFNMKNLDGDLTLLGQDFKLWNNSSDKAYGAGTYKMLGEIYLKAFADPKWQATIQLAEGDKVASFTSFEGTNTGDFMGVPASNKKVMTQGFIIDYYKNGKIEKRITLNDDLTLLQQIGAIPADKK